MPLSKPYHECTNVSLHRARWCINVKPYGQSTPRRETKNASTLHQVAGAVCSLRKPLRCACGSVHFAVPRAAAPGAARVPCRQRGRGKVRESPRTRPPGGVRCTPHPRTIPRPHATAPLGAHRRHIFIHGRPPGNDAHCRCQAAECVRRSRSRTSTCRPPPESRCARGRATRARCATWGVGR